eukprot:4510951-Prymnesium_polylepis.1
MCGVPDHERSVRGHRARARSGVHGFCDHDGVWDDHEADPPVPSVLSGVYTGRLVVARTLLPFAEPSAGVCRGPRTTGTTRRDIARYPSYRVTRWGRGPYTDMSAAGVPHMHGWM